MKYSSRELGLRQTWDDQTYWNRLGCGCCWHARDDNRNGSHVSPSSKRRAAAAPTAATDDGSDGNRRHEAGREGAREVCPDTRIALRLWQRCRLSLWSRRSTTALPCPLSRGGLRACRMGLSYMGWIPVMRLLSPATDWSSRRNALMIAAHMVCGSVIAMLVERDRTR